MLWTFLGTITKTKFKTNVSKSNFCETQILSEFYWKIDIKIALLDDYYSQFSNNNI